MCNTLLNKFCLVQNFGAPQKTSWREIKELMQSAQVNNICKAIAALDTQDIDYQQKKDKLKNIKDLKGQ